MARHPSHVGARSGWAGRCLTFAPLCAQLVEDHEAACRALEASMFGEVSLVMRRGVLPSIADSDDSKLQLMRPDETLSIRRRQLSGRSAKVAPQPSSPLASPRPLHPTSLDAGEMDAVLPPPLPDAFFAAV